MVVWLIAAALWGVVVIGRGVGRARDRAVWRAEQAELDAERADLRRQGAQAVQVRVVGGSAGWSELGCYEVERSSSPEPAPWLDEVRSGIWFDDDRGNRVELVPGVTLHATIRSGRSVAIGPGLGGTRFRYDVPTGTELWILGVPPPERSSEEGAYREAHPRTCVLAPIRRDWGYPPGAYRISDDPAALESPAVARPRFGMPWAIAGGAAAGAVAIVLFPPVFASIVNVAIALVAWYRQWEIDG